MKKLGLLIMPLMAVSLLVSCGNGEDQDGFRQITFDQFWDYLDKSNVMEINEGSKKVNVSCQFNPDEIRPEDETDYYDLFINNRLLYGAFDGTQESPNFFTINYENSVVEDKYTYDNPYLGVELWMQFIRQGIYQKHLNLFLNNYYFNNENQVLAIKTEKTIIYEGNRDLYEITGGTTFTTMYFDLNKKTITHIEAKIDKVIFNINRPENPTVLFTSKPFSGHILLDWSDFVPLED